MLALRIVPMVLALLAWEASLFAQTSPPLEPPVAQGTTDVPYPFNAKGDASVLVELVVEKDGSVSRAEVIEGEDPFASQARSTVLTWRFAPARRGDTPIRAKTRARIEFHQEIVEDTPAPTPNAQTQVTPAKPPPEQVTVYGVRHEIGQTTMSAKDVREMPGAFGDPFRAVEALPGVSPVVSGLPYFFIRGAPPNNNGYYLDGIRVPQLFHVSLGPGVVHPALLDRVDFYPGAPPAAYGRYAGAIIAGQTRDPATSFHGEANLRVVDAGALVETPFADGRGSALVAGRYGYPGPIVSAFADINLGYWDYQSRTTWRLGDKDTIGLFAFGSYDYLAQKEPSGEMVDRQISEFHRIDLRHDHALEDGRIRTAVTLGYDSKGTSEQRYVEATYLKDLSAAARLDIDKKLSSSLRFRGGADAIIDDYRLERGAVTDPMARPVPSNADPPPTNLTGGIRADVVWHLTPRVEIVPGARVDIYSSTRGGSTTTKPAFDPRLSTRVTLAKRVAWLSTAGLSHQYPALRVGETPAIFLTGSGFPLDNQRLQTVAQTSQGIEIGLPADLTLTTTGFLSGWSGLTDLTTDCIQIEPATFPAGPRSPPPFTCPNNKPVQGRAYGLEFLLRRPLSKRLSGWLSYTLSRSTREAHFVTPTGGEAIATVVSEFDRTHVLNAVLALDLGRRWRAGSRFVLYSGTPYSALSGNVPVPPYNDRRDPAFFRLDLRLEKRWPLGKTGSFAFVFEGQNVTLSKEYTGLGTDCIGESKMNQTGTTVCTRAKIGPITIPSVGVEAFF